MLDIIIIGLGGALGAILRYAISNSIQIHLPAQGFPVATLTVNIAGCFLIGFLSKIPEIQNLFSPQMRSFLLIGLLGAFTTFSTFGNETMDLFTNGKELLAMANVAIHIILGLSAILLGRMTLSVYYILIP